MPAGTIALTNGSTAVTGTGTNFTSELKAGDFVYVTVGGAPYTLVASTIGSNTQLTLAVAFDGPTTSGLAWNAVPASLQVAITQKILNDFASVARGRILDFQNWQKIYSSDASVTVTRPDRTQFTGPSWGYLAAQFANKIDKSALDSYAKNGANSDITGLSGLTTALSIGQGGTGSKTKAAAWSALATYGSTSGTAAQGNDSRLNTVDGKSGGDVSGGINLNGGGLRVSGTTGTIANSNTFGWSAGILDIVNNPGSNTGAAKILLRMVNTDNSANLAVYTFQNNGVGLAPGGWQTGSDERIKEDIQDIDPAKALDSVINMRHVTFKMRDTPDGTGGWRKGARSAGYLAQDLEKYLPEAVSTADTPKTFDEEGNQTGFPYQCQADDGSVLEIEDMKSVDPGKAAAALNGAAIKALYDIIQKQDAVIAELQTRMKAIDGLDA